MDPAATVTPPYVAGPLRLAPFAAIRLAPTKVADPAAARLFSRPLHDVQRRLDTWERRGFLTRDLDAALYLHEYTASGITVRGLVGALDVSRRAVRPDDRAVFPHEGIHPVQADDLADRMLTMGINPAPILLVQRSPAALRAELARVREQQDPRHFTDHADQAHRIWTITDGDTVDRITALLATTTAVIADGHHRYAAYLRLQSRYPSTSLDRGLAMLVDQGDTPLFLGAIHRVLVGTAISDVEVAARDLQIDITATDRVQAMDALAPHRWVATDGERWLVLEPGPDTRADVEQLHDVLVPALPHGPTRVGFHHHAVDAIERSAPGQATALLLPAPSIEQLEATVTANRLMPEKATSFQPKPPHGVFIRSLHDEPPAPPSPPPRPGTPRRRRS